MESRDMLIEGLEAIIKDKNRRIEDLEFQIRFKSNIIGDNNKLIDELYDQIIFLSGMLRCREEDDRERLRKYYGKK